MGVKPVYKRSAFLLGTIAVILSPLLIGNIFISESVANQGGGAVGVGAAVLVVLGIPTILLFGSIMALIMSFLRVKQKWCYFLGFFLPAVAVNALLLL